MFAVVLSIFETSGCAGAGVSSVLVITQKSRRVNPTVTLKPNMKGMNDMYQGMLNMLTPTIPNMNNRVGNVNALIWFMSESGFLIVGVIFYYSI